MGYTQIILDSHPTHQQYDGGGPENAQYGENDTINPQMVGLIYVQTNPVGVVDISRKYFEIYWVCFRSQRDLTSTVLEQYMQNDHNVQDK